MDFVLTGHNLEHAVQTVIQVFYPNESYKRLQDVPQKGLAVESRYSIESESGLYSAYVYSYGQITATAKATLKGTDKKAHTQAAAAAIFLAVSGLMGYSPPWGTLTGVRPAKIITELVARGENLSRASTYLKEAYLVRDDKVALCAEVAQAELGFLASSGLNDIGIYIGIPFCPTRCGYCSFTSYPLKKHGGQRELYLEALLKEIEFLGKITKGKKVTAVYVGGGTPTSLEPEMLKQLVHNIRGTFDGSYEFTAEAGRPDSICADKLRILKDFGITRLAINPQTMKNETLARIGRQHTAEDFKQAYIMAADMGFDNINCDVILGLPGESLGDIESTFRELERLSPASLTVHTLALKRAADFNHSFGRYGLAEDNAIPGISLMESMLDIAGLFCREMGLKPYYMYRQKNMVGNFENIGYAIPGYQSIYNHMTMTEARSVYAAGAGAVTKVVYPETNLIKRGFNVKNLDEYIQRIDEMIERKNPL